MAKILIIEDSLDLLDFLSIFMGIHEFEVKAVSTKKEVQSVLDNFKPDIILLDVWLGLDNGREICKEIKEKNKNLPIILMSANTALLKDHYLCEADDIIEKPFENNSVISKVNALLKKSKENLLMGS